MSRGELYVLQVDDHFVEDLGSGQDNRLAAGGSGQAMRFFQIGADDGAHLLFVAGVEFFA